jgi:hypothetical protein
MAQATAPILDSTSADVVRGLAQIRNDAKADADSCNFLISFDECAA